MVSLTVMPSLVGALPAVTLGSSAFEDSLLAEALAGALLAALLAAELEAVLVPAHAVSENARQAHTAAAAMPDRRVFLFVVSMVSPFRFR